jgi:hypothetical protein
MESDLLVGESTMTDDKTEELMLQLAPSWNLL